MPQCHTIALTPVALHGVTHTQSRSKFLQFSRCRGSVALQPPTLPKKDLVAPILPSSQRCYRSIFHVKTEIALHRGVAATLSRVALHCATKVSVRASCQKIATLQIVTMLPLTLQVIEADKTCPTKHCPCDYLF